MTKRLQSVKYSFTVLENPKVGALNLTMPKKIERGTLWDFSTSILSPNITKIREVTFIIKLQELSSDIYYLLKSDICYQI